MKRNNITAALVLFFIFGIAANINAQSRNSLVTPFRKGSVTLNLGVGLGTDYKNDFRSSSALGTKAAVEFGIWQAGPGVISLGAEVGATTSNRSKYEYNDYRAQTVVIAGRSAWHYGWKVQGLDTYAGASAGIGLYHSNYYRNNRNEKNSYNDAFPVIGGFVGASYFVTPRFGFNAEAGFDITSIQGGVIFKFR